MVRKIKDLTVEERQAKWGWISRERNGDELYQMAQTMIRGGVGWVEASRRVRGDGAQTRQESADG